LLVIRPVIWVSKQWFSFSETLTLGIKSTKIFFFGYLPPQRELSQIFFLSQRTAGSFMKTTGFSRVLKHPEPELLFKKSKNHTTTLVET
jgi:hypothetical protein